LITRSGEWCSSVCTNVVWTTSISWSSTSLLSGMVCTRTSLTRLSMNGKSDSEHVCMQRVDSSNTLY